MFIRKRAQSTAEYAIAIGLVIAVAAGVLQVALKGGIRSKHKEAMNFLADAGSSSLTHTDHTIGYESSETRDTTIRSADYIDQTIQRKGGALTTNQVQTTNTETSTTEDLLD